ncbi:lachesin-like isoform X1 [Daphnia pulicaria]|uniref:lachesin-like isoform X1 n=1 Tax=Daphnia pulicaria TaxID=35523 RepID=UPI001EE9FA39|nr:lachesin-like isoform X1 [Daphnia pulicaria]
MKISSCFFVMSHTTMPTDCLFLIFSLAIISSSTCQGSRHHLKTVTSQQQPATEVDYGHQDVFDNSLWSPKQLNNNEHSHPMAGGHDFVLPRFAEPVNNVTVVAGRDVTMHCVVDNLQKFKVAWVRVDTHSILTIHNKVITRNYRIGLAQADGRNWDLKISNAAENDRGFYMCQINTDPMRYQEAYVEVVVPPDIIDGESSTDTVVREGSNVSLTCAASGHPQPHILWRREDGASIARGKLKANSFEGEVLGLARVSRLHIGAYLCIASNGVPPSVSKRIVLNVQFAPVLWIPNQLEGTVVGQQVSLVCQIEAFPIPIVYWTTESGEIIIDNSRFSMKVSLENEYKMTMTLTIRNLSAEFFGGYRCIVRNSLGETDGMIRLYEVPAVPRSSVDTEPPYDTEMEDSQSDNVLLKIRERNKHPSTSNGQEAGSVSIKATMDSTGTVSVSVGQPSPAADKSSNNGSASLYSAGIVGLLSPFAIHRLPVVVVIVVLHCTLHIPA